MQPDRGHGFVRELVRAVERHAQIGRLDRVVIERQPNDRGKLRMLERHSRLVVGNNRAFRPFAAVLMGLRFVVWGMGVPGRMIMPAIIVAVGLGLAMFVALMVVATLAAEFAVGSRSTCRPVHVARVTMMPATSQDRMASEKYR